MKTSTNNLSLRNYFVEQEYTKCCDYRYSHSNDVELCGSCQPFEITFLEGFKSHLGQVLGLPTLASRRITWAKQSITFKFQPFDLARMQSSSVISTRSWRGPCVDLFTRHAYAHGVSRINRLDLMPTDSKFGKRIGDNDTFVKESDFRSNKKQISQITYQSSQEYCDQISSEIANKDCLNNQDSGESVGNRRGNPNSFRAKNVRILHPVIFSHLSWTKGSAA